MNNVNKERVFSKIIKYYDGLEEMAINCELEKLSMIAREVAPASRKEWDCLDASQQHYIMSLVSNTSKFLKKQLKKHLNLN